MTPKGNRGRRQGPGSNTPGAPSYAELVNLVDTFQQNIYPGVAGRDMIETFLQDAGWDLDAAIAEWRRRRQALLAQQAQGGAQVPANNVVPSSSSSTSSSTCSDSSASSSPSPSPPPSARPATATLPIPRRSATSTPAKPILRLHMRNSRPPPRASQVTAAQSAVPFNESYEQERRDAALALRLHIEEVIGERGLISPAAAILMLNRHRWDLTQTAKDFGKLETPWETTRHRLARTYDQMRTPMQQEVADREQRTISMQQSERLAELINITGRNDWYSLRVCLQSHSWDLVAAVSQWFTQGITPVQAPRSVEHGGVRVDSNLQRLPMPTRDETRSASSLEGWAPEPEEFAEPGEEDGNSSTEEDSTLIKQDRKRIPGFLINSTRATAKKGLRNDNLFLIEYIHRGRYWFNRFEQQANLKWPGVGFTEEAHGHNPRPDPAHLVEFDWQNQRHVDWLNNWRRQNCDRVTSLKKRAEAQKWSAEELQFLYDLSDELLKERVKENPHKTEDQLLPMKLTKEIKANWRTLINEKFSGTIQKGSTKPRIDREETAIMTQRSRTRAIVDRFKVKEDKDYFKKTAAAKEARAKAAAELARGDKRSRDGDDSDDGVLETDSEDDDSHKDKRGRTGEDSDKDGK